MDIFETIAHEIDVKTAQLKDALSSGRTPTFDEYKMLCGEIKGLLYVKEYIRDLKQQLENSDNE